MAWVLLKTYQDFDFSKVSGLREPNVLMEHEGVECSYKDEGSPDVQSAVVLVDTDGDQELDHLFELKSYLQKTDLFCNRPTYHYYHLRAFPSDANGTLCFQGEEWKWTDPVHIFSYLPTLFRTFRVYVGDIDLSRPGEEMLLGVFSEQAEKTVYFLYGYEKEKVTCPEWLLPQEEKLKETPFNPSPSKRPKKQTPSDRPRRTVPKNPLRQA